MRWLELADVEPTPIEWLWEPFLARRKLTVLAGTPGLGKSLCALWVASQLSRPAEARTMPCGNAPPDPQRTMLLMAEDDVDDTIVPRLVGLEADRTKFCIHETPFAVGDAEAREVLALQVERWRPDLVVLDPIQFYMGATVNMGQANQVRGFLGPLVEMARKHGFALLALGHYAKGRRANAMDKVLGSVDITAAARLVWAAKAAGERRVVLQHVKTNQVEGLGPTLEWARAARGEPPVPFALRLGNGLDVDALLEEEEDTAEGLSTGGATTLAECVEWLGAALADAGAKGIPSKDLAEEAKERGWAKRTLERARRTVHAETGKDGGRWTTWAQGMRPRE